MNPFKRNKPTIKVTTEPEYIELYEDEFELVGSIKLRVWVSLDYFTLVFRDSNRPARKDNKAWDWIFTQAFKKQDVNSGSLRELALKTYNAHVEAKTQAKKIETWLESEISKLKKGNGKLIKTLKNETE